MSKHVLHTTSQKLATNPKSRRKDASKQNKLSRCVVRVGLSLILLSSCCLQGCLLLAGATVGAAITAGVVYDKRTANASEEDHKITETIQAKLSQIPEINNHAHIVISTFNRVVLIAGQAPNKVIEKEIIAITQTVPGIDSIYNELTINGNPSGMAKFNDSWINTKVKAKLAATDGLESSQIQVVTVQGNVYLMGIVSKLQGSIAVDAARHVSGVQKVVKIFKYVDAPQ